MTNKKLQIFFTLATKKQRAIRARAEGTKLEAISAELSVPYRTIQNWLLPSGRYYGQIMAVREYLAREAMGM